MEPLGQVAMMPPPPRPPGPCVLQLLIVVLSPFSALLLLLMGNLICHVVWCLSRSLLCVVVCVCV